MNVDELVEEMHRTGVPSEPDLLRISRQGRRIGVRRRSALAAGVTTIAALVAGPWLVLGDGLPGGAASPAGVTTTDRPDVSAELTFEATAPLGAPVGAVAQTEMKFYVTPHGGSVGALALWSEAGADPDVLAYGARLIDADGSLRRAGYFHAPVLPATGAELARVPGQPSEPTYVGLVPVPAGARADGYRVRIEATDTFVVKGKSTDVVPGRLLIWATASDGTEPGTDLATFTVRDATNRVVARGTFSR